MSLRFLAAGLVAGFVLSLAPTAPAFADEGPVVRQPRARVAPPRVRVAPVRTVVRTVDRVRYVPVYYTTGCGGCAPAPQPVVYQTAYTTCGGCAPAVAAPAYVAPRYYAPRYYVAGCGGCGRPYVAPYSWAVRFANYRAAYGYGYGAGYHHY
jgi:hypothetical protein